MKRSVIILLTLGVACAFGFMSCASVSGVDASANGTVTAGKAEGVMANSAVEPVETKSKPDSVGDVVLNDGTAVAYENVSKMSAAQKEKAVAVIFYKGTECSNDGKERMLGVGLLHGSAVWRDDKNNATKLPAIAPIKCHIKVNTKENYYGSEEYQKNKKKIFSISKVPELHYIIDSYEFSGDKDGSDNFELIGAFLTSNKLQNDATNIENYPAFAFAKNYKDFKKYVAGEPQKLSFGSFFGSGSKDMGTTKGVHIADMYKDGWYLPSIAELFQIYKNKDTVNTASELCGGDQFTGTYISASQYENSTIDGETLNILGANAYVHSLDFSKGKCGESGKTDHYGSPVCAIRAF